MPSAWVAVVERLIAYAALLVRWRPAMVLRKIASRMVARELTAIVVSTVLKQVSNARAR